MKKIILPVVIGLALIAASSASAAVKPNLDKGTMEMHINGSYDNNHPLDYQLTLIGGFGYFVMDNLEIAAIAGIQSNDLADSYELGAIAEYNFTTNSPWVPFLKAGILWTGVEYDDDLFNDSGDIDETAWIGRIGGGVKYFLRDDIAISLSLNYDRASEDLYVDDDGSAEDYNVKALIGVAYYFD